MAVTRITLSNGSSTWRIATNVDDQDSTTRNWLLCVGQDGFLTSGENDSEAVERSYSHGAVLPPAPRYAGMSFSLDFAIYSLGNPSVDVYGIMRSFTAFLRSGTLHLTSDWPHDLQVQCQKVDVTSASYRNTPRMQVKATFKAAQAFTS